jgi:hypothetical protein
MRHPDTHFGRLQHLAASFLFPLFFFLLCSPFLLLTGKLLFLIQFGAQMMAPMRGPGTRLPSLPSFGDMLQDLGPAA